MVQPNSNGLRLLQRLSFRICSSVLLWQWTCEAVALVTHLIYLDDSLLTDAHRWALLVDVAICISSCRVRLIR